MERTLLKNLTKQASINRALQQEQRLKHKQILYNITKGKSPHLIYLYQQVIQINKKIKIFSESIFIGERYEPNIQRITKLRRQKEKLVGKLILKQYGKEGQKRKPKPNNGGK